MTNTPNITLINSESQQSISQIREKYFYKQKNLLALISKVYEQTNLSNFQMWVICTLCHISSKKKSLSLQVLCPKVAQTKNSLGSANGSNFVALPFILSGYLFYQRAAVTLLVCIVLFFLYQYYQCFWQCHYIKTAPALKDFHCKQQKDRMLWETQKWGRYFLKDVTCFYCPHN